MLRQIRPLLCPRAAPSSAHLPHLGTSPRLKPKPGRMPTAVRGRRGRGARYPCTCNPTWHPARFPEELKPWERAQEVVTVTEAEKAFAEDTDH